MQIGTESVLSPAAILGSLPRPFKLTYALTYRCNSKCELCHIWKRTGGSDELSLHEIRRFFEKNNQFLWVDITGGEIFLRDDLLDVARTIVENCRSLAVLHFPTNGLLTDEIVAAAREMRGLGVPRLVITVSLDGPLELHDKLRGVEGSWARSLETFSRLREIEGVDAYIGMTLSQFNTDAILPGIRRAQEAIAIDDDEIFHLNVAHFSDHFYRNLDHRVMLDEATNRMVERFLETRGKAHDFGSKLERIYLEHLRQFIEVGRRPLPCRALDSSCFIDPRGQVFPCIIFGEPLGNLREVDYDLKTLWDRSRREALVDRIRRGDCPHCWTPCEAYVSILENEEHLESLLATIGPDGTAVGAV